MTYHDHDAIPEGDHSVTEIDAAEFDVIAGGIIPAGVAVALFMGGYLIGADRARRNRS